MADTTTPMSQEEIDDFISTHLPVLVNTAITNAAKRVIVECVREHCGAALAYLVLYVLGTMDTREVHNCPICNETCTCNEYYTERFCNCGNC